MKRNIFLMLLLVLFFGACNKSPQKSAKTDQPQAEEPLAWSNDAVMYEVNVRQYTPEGTFEAFAEHLPRLKELGVEILWFMPIHPIGEKNRKGSLGSYYSIQDYKAINPEFGTLEDFKELVDKAHSMGFKVLLDFVANHTAWDHNWIETHPEWYTQDSLGNIVPPVADWSDVADLNFDNPDLRAELMDALKYWLQEADIDGYRCDYAGGVPADFWETARTELDKIKPVFMLAEDQDNVDLLKNAFDCNYSWTMHHYMNEIYSEEKTVSDVKSYFEQVDTTYIEGTYPLQFTSNHDENSWSGTVYERLGDAVKTFAVLSFTVPGMPLVYSGQEVGLDKRLEFFEKDEINWENGAEMTAFYAALIDLKQENQALWNGSFGGWIDFPETSVPEKLLAFKREKGDNTVWVVMNLSDETLDGTVAFGEEIIVSNYFSGKEVELKENAFFHLNPWEYLVLVKK